MSFGKLQRNILLSLLLCTILAVSLGVGKWMLVPGVAFVVLQVLLVLTKVVSEGRHTQQDFWLGY